MIYVIAELRIRPDAPASALDEVRKLVAATVKEEGCISYDVHRSLTDPDRWAVVERWKSREALTVHTQTPHFKAWREVADFVAERKIEVITPERVDPL